MSDAADLAIDHGMYGRSHDESYAVFDCWRKKGSRVVSGPGNCPKCDGPTVKKNGRHGPFYGCVNFPKCKGSRNASALEKQNG